MILPLSVIFLCSNLIFHYDLLGNADLLALIVPRHICSGYFSDIADRKVSSSVFYHRRYIRYIFLAVYNNFFAVGNNFHFSFFILQCNNFALLIPHYFHSQTFRYISYRNHNSPVSNKRFCIYLSLACVLSFSTYSVLHHIGTDSKDCSFDFFLFLHIIVWILSVVI